MGEPGFRGYLLVLLSWPHDYGLSDRAIRLILFPVSADFHYALSNLMASIRFDPSTMSLKQHVST
ncbi:MAG: hypothetical protein AAFN40_16575 [Cyanobacteria bacterium J06560_6]